MKALAFSSFLTLSLLFAFIAGFSKNVRGFQTALFLASLFLFLTLYFR